MVLGDLGDSPGDCVAQELPHHTWCCFRAFKFARGSAHGPRDAGDLMESAACKTCILSLVLALHPIPLFLLMRVSASLCWLFAYSFISHSGTKPLPVLL